MIDAWSAASIGFITEHGEIIGDSELPDSVRDSFDGNTNQEWADHIEEHGYQAISRYSIHEIESSNWSDLEWAGVPGLEDFNFSDDSSFDYQDETVNGIDVSAYVGVHSDWDGQRIE